MAATLVGMKLTLNATDKGTAVPSEMLMGGNMGAEIRQTRSGSYLASQVAILNRDYDAAAHFTKLMQEDNELSQELLQRNLRVLAAAGALDAAETLAKRIEKKDDALSLLVTAGQALREERYTDASKDMHALPSDGVYKLLKPLLSAWAAAGEAKKKGDNNELEEAFKPLSQGWFPGRFARYQQALIYDWLGDEAKARSYYDAMMSTTDAPPFHMAHAAANFFLRQGDIEAAKGAYESYREGYPNSGITPPPIPETAQEAQALEPMVQSAAEGAAEVYFALASLLFGEQAHQEVIFYLRLALALRPDLPPAQMLLASLLEQQERHQDAVQVYQAIDKESVYYKQGRLRIALNYHAAQRKAEAIQLLWAIVADEPTNEDALNLLGDILRHDEQPGAAVQVFSKAIDASPDYDWGWPFYYKFGIALERQSEWEKAEVMFMKALEIEPEQPDVLNYLGYSWLEQGKKFEEAKDYIERAYVQRPDQAHIIDSMGWAHFKLQEYQQALPLIEEATDLAPHDPTVNEHLGDVYWRLGRKREARYQWERALTFEPEKPDEVKAKIEKGLPLIESEAR